jgi:hypothetical protein
MLPPMASVSEDGRSQAQRRHRTDQSWGRQHAPKFGGLCSAAGVAALPIVEILARRGIRSIFTVLQQVRCVGWRWVRRENQAEKPRWSRLLLELDAPTAQIPVISLWTACTRLKTNHLQPRIFH